MKRVPDDDLRDLIANLGGHDLPCLIDILNQADAVDDAPAVVFAYTVKGFGLPMAGDPLNHSQLLTQKQMDALQIELGVDGDDLGDASAGSPGGRVVQSANERLRDDGPPGDVAHAVALPKSSTRAILHRRRRRKHWAERSPAWLIST